MNSFAMLRCSLFKFRARTPGFFPNGSCFSSRRLFSSSECVNRAYRQWTPEEDQMIRSLRQKGLRTQDIASQISDRTFNQVRERMSRLFQGSIPPRQVNMWDSQEDAILLEKYHAGLRIKQIMQYLPGRTAKAIAGRLLVLVPTRKERRPWTPAERQQVVDLITIDGWSVRATAEALERSSNSVASVFYRFGQRGEPVDNPHKRWTPAERQRVVDLRINSGLTFEAIAEEIGRSCSSVSHVWVKYGKRTLPSAVYQSPRNSAAWTPEEHALVVALREKGLTFAEISKQIPGRSPAAIQSHVYVRQLTNTKRRTQRPTKPEMDAIRPTLIPVLDGSTTYDEAVSKLEPRLQRMASAAFRRMKKERSEHGSPPSAGSPT